MSLLNDALRAAEQRQQRPDAPSAYTGGAVQGGPSGNRWWILGALVLVLAVAAAGACWLLVQSGKTSASESATPLSESGQGKVQRPEPAQPDQQPLADRESGSAAEASTQVESPAPVEPRVTAASQPEPESESATTAVAPESEQVAAVEPEETPPKQVQERPVAVEPQREVADSSASSSPSPAQTSETDPADTPVIKSTPRSPDAIDRKAARDLKDLISDGRLVEAERRLASLTQTQQAPRSRFVVARALLVDGDTARALIWLPVSATTDDAPLRMLRARALHADGQLQAAVATLQSRVPAVADQPEYRVTLATLLQQLGDSQEAARHWAELLAWDDSRAPWWVGLAVSLEDQGQTRSAARAYEQAAALPGLPPSLEEYVQRRLRSLRAG